MRHFNLGARLGDLRRFISGKIKLIYHLCRLSVSESSEWVCTKTIFTNGSVVRGCHKTYTGNFSGKIATSSTALQCVPAAVILSSYPIILLFPLVFLMLFRFYPLTLTILLLQISCKSSSFYPPITLCFLQFSSM